MLSQAFQRYPKVAPAERLLYQGRIWIGNFRCRPDDACFGHGGPSGGYLIVFPRRAVRICHPGRHAAIADTHRVMLYNRGSEYRREAVDPAGDDSIYLGFSLADVCDAVVRLGLEHERLEQAPFAWIQGRCPESIFVSQRRLVAHLAYAAEPDPLYIEETAFELLDGVLTGVDATPLNRRCATGRTAARHAALAHGTLELLVTRGYEPLKLANLAAEMGSSPFHLSRVFRTQFGLPINRYLNAWRLRQVLDWKLDAPDSRLTDLALDAGFSSLSHFSRTCRDRFGQSPRQVLAKLLS